MATEPKNKQGGYSSRSKAPTASKTNEPRGNQFKTIRYSGKKQKLR